MTDKLRAELMKIAASAYLDNTTRSDFPEDYMRMLADGRLTDGKKRIVPWTPLRDVRPESLHNAIASLYYDMKNVVDKMEKGEYKDE